MINAPHPNQPCRMSAGGWVDCSRRNFTRDPVGANLAVAVWIDGEEHASLPPWGENQRATVGGSAEPSDDLAARQRVPISLRRISALLFGDICAATELRAHNIAGPQVRAGRVVAAMGCAFVALLRPLIGARSGADRDRSESRALYVRVDGICIRC